MEPTLWSAYEFLYLEGLDSVSEVPDEKVTSRIVYALRPHAEFITSHDVIAALKKACTRQVCGKIHTTELTNDQQIQEQLITNKQIYSSSKTEDHTTFQTIQRHDGLLVCRKSGLHNLLKHDVKTDCSSAETEDNTTFQNISSRHCLTDESHIKRA